MTSAYTVNASVPKGWEELLSNFARETLRSQPGDLYTFAAQYFKNEHRRREDGRTGTADINNDNNNVFGNQSNNDEGAESDLDYDDPAVEDAAIMIQARFRGYRSRKNSQLTSPAPPPEIDIDLNDPEVHAAATKIQAQYRGFRARQSVEEQKLIEKDAAAIAAIDLNDPKTAEAAVKIQAGFRGHQTRSKLRRRGSSVTSPSKKSPSKTPKPEKEVFPDLDLNDPALNAAATKIQGAFRGFKSKPQINLTEKGLAELKRLFDELDKDGNGTVSKKEWGSALTQHASTLSTFFGGNTLSQIGKKFKEIDTDGSGDLSWDEVKTAVNTANETGDGEAGAVAPAAKAEEGSEVVAPATDEPTATTTGEEVVADGGEEKPEAMTEAAADVAPPSDDSELNAAATKIQAGFRGHKARRSVLTKRGVQELKALFAAMDKDGDGNVSIFEWADKVKGHATELSKYFGGASVEEVSKRFASADTDRSGGLTWAEIESMATRTTKQRAATARTGLDELKTLFAELDKDGNGSVSKKEWGQGVSGHAEVLGAFFGGETLCEIGKQFKSVDTDGSGDITWDEVAAAVKRTAAGIEESASGAGSTVPEAKVAEGAEIDAPATGEEVNGSATEEAASEEVGGESGDIVIPEGQKEADVGIEAPAEAEASTEEAATETATESKVDTEASEEASATEASAPASTEESAETTESGAVTAEAKVEAEAEVDAPPADASTTEAAPEAAAEATTPSDEAAETAESGEVSPESKTEAEAEVTAPAEEPAATEGVATEEAAETTEGGEVVAESKTEAEGEVVAPTEEAVADASATEEAATEEPKPEEATAGTTTGEEGEATQ